MPFLLDANREPIFADLVTDPRFAEVANEFLQPRSYSERHDEVMLHGVECTACAPHRIVFLASNEGKRVAPTTLREGVVIQGPGAGRRRGVAKSHGPQPKRKRTT